MDVGLLDLLDLGNGGVQRGLLLCVAEANMDEVLNVLREAETLSSSIIGKILPAEDAGGPLMSVIS